MKKSIKLMIMIGLICSNLMTAQKWFGKKIKGNGKEITEKRNTTDYDGIKISGNLDVQLKSGKEGEIVVQCEENIMQYIKIEVVDKILKIGIDPSMNIQHGHDKKMLVIVPFESLNSIVLLGSSDLKSISVIKSDKLSLVLSGSGDMDLIVESGDITSNVSGSGEIEIKGIANNFDVNISGSGEISANNLMSKNANINISGSAKVKVNCSENLKGRVSGSGDIYYSGNPKVKDTKVSGSGEIKAI